MTVLGAAVFNPTPVKVALVGAFMTMAGFYAVVFVQSLYCQQLRGASALLTGGLFLPMTGVLAVSQLAAARLAARIGNHPLLVGGLLLEALGLGLLAILPAHAPTWLASLTMVPVGIGGAATLPPIVAMVLDHGLPTWPALHRVSLTPVGRSALRAGWQPSAPLSPPPMTSSEGCTSAWARPRFSSRPRQAWSSGYANRPSEAGGGRAGRELGCLGCRIQRLTSTPQRSKRDAPPLTATERAA